MADRKLCTSLSVTAFDKRMKELQSMQRVACPHCGTERYYDVRKSIQAGDLEAMGGCHAHGTGGCGKHFVFAIERRS